MLVACRFGTVAGCRTSLTRARVRQGADRIDALRARLAGDARRARGSRFGHRRAGAHGAARGSRAAATGARAENERSTHQAALLARVRDGRRLAEFRLRIAKESSKRIAIRLTRTRLPRPDRGTA